MFYISYCNTDGLTKQESARSLHLKAHELLKTVLYDYGIDDYETEKNRFGKPYLKGFPLFFNLSHCSGLVCCAVHTSEIGIDAENIRAFNEKILSRSFTAAETAFINASPDRNKAFFRIWTLKESYIKNIGKGLSFPMKNIEFDLSDINNIKSSDETKQFFQCMTGNYIISVCTEKNSEFEFIYRIK